MCIRDRSTSLVLTAALLGSFFAVGVLLGFGVTVTSFGALGFALLAGRRFSFPGLPFAARFALTYRLTLTTRFAVLSAFFVLSVALPTVFVLGFAFAITTFTSALTPPGFATLWAC